MRGRLWLICFMIVNLGMIGISLLKPRNPWPWLLLLVPFFLAGMLLMWREHGAAPN